MEWLDLLERFGLPLVLLAMIVIGRFVPGFIYLERKKELEDANAEIKRLNEIAFTKLAPALTSTADAMESATALLRQIQMERDLDDRRARDRRPDGLDR